MEEIIEKNIERIKQRFEQVLQLETIKYIEMQAEEGNPEKFMEEHYKHLQTLFEGEFKASILNGVSKPKRKEFIRTHGIQTENTNTKQVNTLIREVLLQNIRFDYKKWIREYYVHNLQKWKENQENAVIGKRQKEMVRELEEVINNLYKENILYFYLPLRSQMANQVASDVLKDRFKLNKKENGLFNCGPFKVDSYFKVGDFSAEYNGEQADDFYSFSAEYETYLDTYEAMVTKYVYYELPFAIADLIPKELTHRLSGMFTKEKLHEKIYELLEDKLANLELDFLHQLMEELMEDMLVVAGKPYELETHKNLYIRQIAEKKAKINAHKRKEYLRYELEKEEQRKKAKEEEEMILQIIGREYEANLSPNTKYILHIGETNTGKTHTALTEMRKAASGLYLGPLRLLALEVYETLSNYGVACGLKTGEEEKDLEGATHISATVEMFSTDERYECVVIDEAQMIADRDRGFSWYKAITAVQADTVHIIGSRNVKSMLLQLLDGNNIEVIEYQREIPLVVQQKNFRISKVTKGDALIIFSRKKVLQVAAKLESDGHKVSVVYGGMPPETRQKQIEQFHKGETEVVVSTDAIGMGLNLPIRRVVFLENEKFDGTRVRTLTSQEVKQIAGRAGRKGKYEQGFVAFSSDVQKMKNLLEKKDREIQTFAISPTQNIFNRFRQFGKDLNEFFRLWDKYENPFGTVKAPLTEEKELYEEIRGTEIEARFSVAELYSFLHLPFSSYEPTLKEQWKENMLAIINNHELQEPTIERGSLDALELSYKAIGLHLLFLYRLERRTEAYLWERLRDEISDEIHGLLKQAIKDYTKKCKFCDKVLKWDYPYSMCQNCHNKRYGNDYYYEDRWR